MKTFSLLALGAILASVEARSLNPLAAREVGGSCNSPEGPGRCLNTGNCPGISYTGLCPNDATDVKCCVEKRCTPPGAPGICKNTNKGCPGGAFKSGHCPGDDSIQCCVSNGPAPGPAPTPVPSRAPNPGPRPECSNPRRDTCSFYTTCLEPKYRCGPEGYPIGYGKRYCDLFNGVKPQFSARGKKWVSDTMLCLQRTLVPYATRETTTCANLKKVAFASHPRCYVDNGVCVLGIDDWEVIIRTVSLKELFGSLDALKATLQTAQGCGEFYLWLISRGVIIIVDEVKERAKDLWDKVTDWF